MRYIDADKAKITYSCKDMDNVADLFNKWLDNQPTADVRENVRGEWIKKEGSLWTLATCSVCGELSVEGDKPFCPNCGADMRGGE